MKPLTTSFSARRDFLKKTALGSATCAISGALPGTLAAMGTPALKSTGNDVRSICEMCSTRCPITVQVQDGKKLFIRGNEKAKAFGGKVCARGGAGYSLLYDPQRLVQPLKRVGKRGEGKWEPISWQEAYRSIAARMNALKEKHGAESIAFSSKSGSLAPHLFHLARAFGSPNTFTHGTTCPIGYQSAGVAMLGTANIGRDFSATRYVLNFGHNVYEGINMSQTRALMAAHADKKLKLVAFDPRLSVIADKADEWYAIKPGTDLAVTMALCHVLIKEKLYNRAFIERHVEGFEAFAAETESCTPEWAEGIANVPAADLRRIAREFSKAAPAAIADFGHRSNFTPEEFDFRRSLYALNVLIGNIDCTGGLTLTKDAKLYNTLAGETVAPELSKFEVKDLPKITAKRIDQSDPQYELTWGLGGIYQTVNDAVLDNKPYPVRGWILSRSNPLQTMTTRARTEACMQALDLVVVCDVYISETAAMADFILPENTYLERDEEITDMSGKNPAYAIRQQAVEIIGNSKPSWLIWKELGNALGLSQFFPWETMETLRLAQLKGDTQTLAKIKTEGYTSYGKPLLFRDRNSVQQFVEAYPAGSQWVDADGLMSAQVKFKTPSGKIELSSSRIEKAAKGRGTLRYRPVTLKKEDELYFIQGKVALHTNAGTQNVPLLNALMPESPLWMHPDTASTLALKDGDPVIVTSSVGEEKATLLLTNGIRPDTVFAYMGFGNKNKELTRAYGKGLHCGNLLPEATSPICGAQVHTTGVKVRKATVTS